jgi:hypothetical protein
MTTKPDWFPDWSGLSVAIVASGPSTKKVDVERLRGKLPVIAIKENVELAPWADVVYGCDRAWWRNMQGLPKYDGLRITATQMEVGPTDIKLITVEATTDKILTDKPGVVGSGGNSGFQALNLAVQFGATRVLMVGFDMDDRAGVHWYGRNSGMGRSNPSEWNFRRWRVAFINAVPVLDKLGVEVLNASQHTSLNCFPRTTVERTLAEWDV